MRYTCWGIAVLAALFRGAIADPTNVQVEVKTEAEAEAEAEADVMPGPNACTSDMPGGLGPTVM